MYFVARAQFNIKSVRAKEPLQHRTISMFWHHVPFSLCVFLLYSWSIGRWQAWILFYDFFSFSSLFSSSFRIDWNAVLDRHVNAHAQDNEYKNGNHLWQVNVCAAKIRRRMMIEQNFYEASLWSLLWPSNRIVLTKHLNIKRFRKTFKSLHKRTSLQKAWEGAQAHHQKTKQHHQ